MGHLRKACPGPVGFLGPMLAWYPSIQNACLAGSLRSNILERLECHTRLQNRREQVFRKPRLVARFGISWRGLEWKGGAGRKPLP